MAKDYNRPLIAGIFITAGSLLLLSNLDLIELDLLRYLFRWQAILIFIGLLVFLRRRSRGGIVLMGVGGFFLITEVISDIYIDLFNLWPGLIIIIGALLVLPRIKSDRTGDLQLLTDDLDEIAFFGGNQISVESKFSGGSIMAIFGGSTIDLRKSTLSTGANHLNLFTLFGASKIIVPEEMDVKVDVNPILGELSDKRRVSTTSLGDKYLNITGTVVLGGGEIVN